MLTTRSHGLFLACLMSQAVLILALFWATLLLLAWFRLNFALAFPRYAIASCIVVTALLVGGLHPNGYQATYFTRETDQQRRIAFRQITHMAVGLLGAIVFFRDATISRAFLVLFFSTSFFVNLVMINFLPSFWSRILFWGIHQHDLLVLGSPSRLKRFANWLKQSELFGVVIGKSIPFDTSVEWHAKSAQFGILEQVNRELEQHRYAQVVVAGLPTPTSLLNQLIGIAESHGTRLLVLNDLAGVFRHPIHCFRYNGLDFIGFRQEPLQNPLNRACKRLLDVAISLPVVLLILPPLMLAVRLIHRGQSPGPLFYRQPRTGARGRPFEVLKFRTMHIHQQPESLQASEKDPRIFPLGHFLRRSSLDEMPQFLNVLRGEMSVVGPRPHLEAHDDVFAEIQRNYRVRTLTKPGITGLAQVQGFRGEVKQQTDVSDRVSADIEYIENWSLSLDLWIIARTAWQVVKPPRSAR